MKGDGSLRRSTRIDLRSISGVKDNSIPLRIKAEVKSKYFMNTDEPSIVLINNDRLKVEVKEELKEEIPIEELKQPTKKRKIIKHELIELESHVSKPPPKNFEKIYNEVKQMRSKIITPVDSMGSAFLPWKVSGLQGGPVFRYQLLVTLMLSSQTKDEINAEVMQILQSTMKSKGYKDGLCVEAILGTPEKELDTLIHKVGFHNRKLKYIKQTTEIIKEKYNGDIPKTIEELLAFPGVGPKMGYLLLQAAWDITLGLGVDVHIFRLANMWGWVPKVKNPTPENTRLELQKWLPQELWKEFNPIIVGFGQSICTPRGRRCDLCSLLKYGRLCSNVDRALLKKVADGNASPRKVRGDLSAFINDIEDLA